jgi:hypothetical protein
MFGIPSLITSKRALYIDYSVLSCLNSLQLPINKHVND